MEKEYATLREEILHLQQKRDDYTRFAYTVIAAIWTAAFAIKNAYIVLLGMFILMPISVRVTDILYSSGNIAAYLSVFHESKDGPMWETLNYEYRKEHKRNPKTIARYILGRSDFLTLQVLNAVIFWFYRGQPMGTYLAFDIAIIVAQLLVILYTCYQCYRSSVADFKRQDNIDKWQKVKSEAEAER